MWICSDGWLRQSTETKSKSRDKTGEWQKPLYKYKSRPNINLNKYTSIYILTDAKLMQCKIHKALLISLSPQDTQESICETLAAATAVFERIIINARSKRNKRYQYNIQSCVININNVFGTVYIVCYAH